MTFGAAFVTVPDSLKRPLAESHPIPVSRYGPDSEYGYVESRPRDQMKLVSAAAPNAFRWPVLQRIDTSVSSSPIRTTMINAHQNPSTKL